MSKFGNGARRCLTVVMTTSESLLQEILDEFALRKLVHTYRRAVDRGDFATLRQLYHHDAVDGHGECSRGSVDDFLKTIEASRTHIRSMQHNITTVNFAIDGNRAEGEICQFFSLFTR